MTPRLLTAIGLIMEGCYLALYAFTGTGGSVIAFIIVHGVVYALLGWIVFRRMHAKDEVSLAALIGFALLFRLTLLPLVPVASDDIFRYLWDGRVSAAGINPFAYPPTDPRLASLTTPDLPAKINFPAMRTIYPPAAQLFFLLSNVLFGPSIPGMKLLLVIADAGTIVVLLLVLRKTGMRRDAALVYAWSPVPVMYGALEGHIDILGIMFVVLMVFLLGRHHHVRGALALAGAALVKVYPLFLLPFLATVRTGRWRLFLPATPVLIVALSYLVYLEPTGGVVESLAAVGRHWEFNGAAFTLLYPLLGSNDSTHAACALLFVAWLGFVVVLRRSMNEKIFLSFLGFVLLSPVAHPWYFGWLAALLVVRWSTAVFVMLALTNLSNIVVYRYHHTGSWNDDPLLVALEYVPVVLLLVREILRGEFAGHAAGAGHWAARKSSR